MIKAIANKCTGKEGHQFTIRDNAYVCVNCGDVRSLLNPSKSLGK